MESGMATKPQNSSGEKLIIIGVVLACFSLLFVSGLFNAAKNADARKEAASTAYEQGAIDQHLGKIEVIAVLFDAKGKPVKYEVRKVNASN